MQTIKLLSKYVLMIILTTTMLSGCGLHKTYSGHYFIDNCKPIYENNELIKKIEIIAIDIANDFGFYKEKEEYSRQDYDVFVKNKNIKGKYDYLSGSGSDIIFMTDNSRITLRDFTRKIETPFTAKLKMEIENKLKEICTTEPLFKRDSELWN